MRVPPGLLRSLALTGMVTALVLGVVGFATWAPGTSEQRRLVSEPLPVAPPASPAPPAQHAEGDFGRLDPERTAALVERVRARVAADRGTRQPVSFVITTFNILGSQHTAPRSDNDGFAPGRLRTEWAAQQVAAMRSDIIGFSEIQRDQLDAMMATTRDAFDAWPGTALGGLGVPQTLMWRASRFEAIEKRSITIPFVGQRRPQPVVLLRERATDRELWVVNAHNSPNHRVDERNRAMAIETATIRELRKSGLPVLFIGDLNDRAPVFCNITGNTDLRSPAGGSNRDGSCRPPRNMRVDWIFGSPEVSWSGYVVDRSPLVARITDHAVLSATATIR